MITLIFKARRLLIHLIKHIRICMINSLIHHCLLNDRIADYIRKTIVHHAAVVLDSVHADVLLMIVSVARVECVRRIVLIVG